MRKQYIKQVKKELSVSHKLKKEILRDLNEAFDSAAEHGETEEQVINRLGTSKDFTRDVEENMSFDRVQYRKNQKKIVEICCLCGIAIICLIAALISQTSRLPENVIGQGDAMTSITVKSAFPFGLFFILLIAGIVIAVIAAIKIIVFVRNKK